MRFKTKLLLFAISLILLTALLITVFSSLLIQYETSSFTKALRTARDEAIIARLESFYAENGNFAGVEPYLYWLSGLTNDRRGGGMALHRSEGTPPRMVNDDRFVLLSSEGQVIFDTDALADVSKSARAYPPGSTPDLKHQPGTYPLVVNERIVGYLWIDRPVLGTIAQLEASFGRSVQLAVWISALLAMVLAFLLAGFLSRRMVEPVLILTKAIRDYARGNYDTRAKVLGKDEIGELARSFNEMAETLTRLEQVRKNLIADVAHELRTPVTLLRGHLEALLETTEEIPREKLALLHDEALRLGHMIQDLQNLSLAEARALPLHPERFSLDTLIEQIVEVFSLTTAEKNIAVQIEIHPRPLLITADRKRLEQVIVNVYGNAIRATPEGGRITITAEPLIDRSSGEEDQAESAETECVKISITDSGPGFREADLPYVFERFYRSDKGRARKDGGTGLGLAIAKSFIEAHGGKIWAENNAQGGARVTFELCANVQTKDIQS